MRGAGSTSSSAIVAASVAVAALTLLAPHAPGYDPWAWLIWGRELAQGGLSTVDGPAFKPLPVLVDAGLWRLAGDEAAPGLWLLLARAGALAGAGLAARLAFRLAGGSWPAGLVAGGGVLLTAGYAWHGAVGNAEGLALACGVLAVGLALDGRPRPALAAGAALALVRPESWVLLAAYAVWIGRRQEALRPWLAGGAAAVLALWFVPEWLGSGDPLRSGDRARVPNAGAPATAAIPAWAALRAGLALPLLPVLVCALVAPGRARVPALLGLVWILEVALMAQLLGTSGEPRYSLPGAALIAISGAVGGIGLARGAWRARGLLPAWPAAGRVVAGALGAVLLATVVFRAPVTAGELRRAGDLAELTGSLPQAISEAGGRGRVLGCGTPVTGRYRGPAVAWALRVPRRTIKTPAGMGGAVLRSRIRRAGALQPAAPASGRVLGRSRRWLIQGACDREIGFAPGVRTAPPAGLIRTGTAGTATSSAPREPARDDTRAPGEWGTSARCTLRNRASSSVRSSAIRCPS